MLAYLNNRRGMLLVGLSARLIESLVPPMNNRRAARTRIIFY